MKNDPRARELISMTDSSLYNHVDNRATQLGHVNFLDATPYSWKSYHSTTILTSSRDAELVAITDNISVSLRAMEILRELRIPIVGDTPVTLIDNKSVRDNLNSQFSYIQKAYLDAKLQQLKEEVSNSNITVLKIPRDINIADTFCKTELTGDSIKWRRDIFFAESSIIPISNPKGSFSNVKPRGK